MAQFRYKLLIAYDGTHYCGWQVQPESVTVQEVIEDKLEILLKHRPQVTGAGRTDAGVHAMGQAAHFDHNAELDLYKTFASLNGLLPPDIRIKSIEQVPVDFHARYTAQNKIYHYHIDLSPYCNPFERLYSWHIRRKLDLKRLQECTQLFVGTHDFTSFVNEAKPGAATNNPVRTIKRIEMVPEREGIRLEFEGKSFLYKMVRNLTGTIVEVALGKVELGEIPRILQARDRRAAGMTAPAKGLFLMRVDYPVCQDRDGCEDKK